MKKQSYWFEIILIILLFAVAIASYLKADPVCSVELTDNKYKFTIKSNLPRIDDVTSTLPIPERKPIAMNAFYNTCIVYEDKTPAYNVKTFLIASDWNVSVATDFAGCFSSRIASDGNFTIHAINPRDNNSTAKLGGVVLCPKKGTLLSDNHKVIPFNNDLFNIAKFIPEEGITSYAYKNRIITATADVKKKKHGISVEFPTKVGKKYVVTISIDKPISVWFRDGTRGKHNPAVLTGASGLDKPISLDSLTATKTITKLFFVPKNSGVFQVKNISIKRVK